MSVLLQNPFFEGISQKELAEQLETKKKCRDKLPTWFHTPNIYYPNKLNIEQTSSEQTAWYKATLVQGKTLLDLTGGFGVDTYFFSKKIDAVFHCEINAELSEIAGHNFEMLGQRNVTFIPKDGIQYLKEVDKKYDWIYVDPSRRNDVKGKVFLLKDCLPNLTEHLSMIFEKTDSVLIKTSPLLDIKQGICELDFVKEIHVVAVNNEVKELLFLLEKGYGDDVTLKTINILHGQKMVFDFALSKEQQIASEFSKPQQYLYEPNAAILKAGGFKSVGKAFGLKKLHQHSHLYTAMELLDFPGRRFKVLEVLPYSKNALKSFAQEKANITTRNFPISVSELRKRHKIKDGGSSYLFFTKTMDGSLVILDCRKI
ncbi:MAG: class I SAM-dependent methyltransferase [Allomuricauda sp.]